MLVGGLVAFCALGDQSHARILVADAALGDVAFGLAVVGELVRTEELVAPGQRDIALQVHHRTVDAFGLVAGDIGRLLGAVGMDAGGGLRLGEHRDDVLDRAQIPVVRHVLFRMGGQGQGDAERQREQA